MAVLSSHALVLLESRHVSYALLHKRGLQEVSPLRTLEVGKSAYLCILLAAVLCNGTILRLPILGLFSCGSCGLFTSRVSSCGHVCSLLAVTWIDSLN